MLTNLEKALNEALEDEYKAHATYRLVIDKFGPIRPFINIIKSEERHIQALMSLFRKYNLPIPVDNWLHQVEPPNSVLEACQQGVQGEIENREMYNRLLNLTQEYPDVQRVFFNLQRASQENHLPAFERCAGKRNHNHSCGRGGRKDRQGHSGHRHRRGRCFQKLN